MASPAPGPCRLYRFMVIHPDTGQVVLGYIGETGRHPFKRLMEHIDSQPWHDTIEGFHVDPRLFPDKASVLAAEKAAILAELPLYNHEHNLNNPHRIPMDVARQQAAARQAARLGAPPPPAPQRRPAAVRRPSAGRPPARPRWVPSRRTVRRVVRNRFTQWSAVWLTATVGLWAMLPALGSSGAAGFAAIGATWWHVRFRRRRRRR